MMETHSNHSETPIYIIVDHLEAEIELAEQKTVDETWYLYHSGDCIWTLQTHHNLKSMGFRTKLSFSLVPNAINIAHVTTLRKLGPMKNCYVVAIRADKNPIHWANFEVLQNMSQVKRHHQAYITHWPQPGLIPRASESTTVKNVAFSGSPQENCLNKFDVENDIKSLGLNYKIMDKTKWNDFSNIDILLAIRSFNDNQFFNKPPSKLINSWWANIPLITSDDSAYRDIGAPGHNYLIARFYDEMLTHINNLAKDPGLYKQIVQNGADSRENYTREKIASTWIDLIEKRIRIDFTKWQRKSRIFHVKDFIVAKILHWFQLKQLKFAKRYLSILNRIGFKSKGKYD